jgi:hypothetical protein
MESAAYLNRSGGRVLGSVSNPIPLLRPFETVHLFPLATRPHLVERVSTLSSILIVYCYKYLFVVKIIAYQLKTPGTSRAYGWRQRGLDSFSRT